MPVRRQPGAQADGVPGVRRTSGSAGRLLRLACHSLLPFLRSLPLTLAGCDRGDLTLAGCSTVRRAADVATTPMPTATMATGPIPPALAPMGVRPIGPAPAWAPDIDPQMLAVVEQLMSYEQPPLEHADGLPGPQREVGDERRPRPVHEVRHAADGADGRHRRTACCASGRPRASSSGRTRRWRRWRGPRPVIVYYHGGGWVIANLETYEPGAMALAAQTGAVVVSVAYRQAPENKFPAQHEDAFAAYQWVIEHAAEIGGDPARIATAGESAGGNLAVAVALMAQASAACACRSTSSRSTPSPTATRRARPTTSYARGRAARPGRHGVVLPADARPRPPTRATRSSRSRAPTSRACRRRRSSTPRSTRCSRTARSWPRRCSARASGRAPAASRASRTSSSAWRPCSSRRSRRRPTPRGRLRAAFGM